METEQNPRAVIGGNESPLWATLRAMATEENFAATLTEFLNDEYRALGPNVTAMLDEARNLPPMIDDDAVMGDYARLIKRFRDEASRIEAFRVKEKEPYLRGAQAVDALFFSLKEKCIRRDSKAKPGAADVLQARLDDYNQRKLAAEQARLAKEAVDRKREADEAAARETDLQRQADETRLAAERARNPQKIEEKTALAEAADVAASSASVNTQLARGAAEAAHVATLAKPADLVRTRVEEGPTVTMATEPYAVIEDAAKLDKETLWPFISLDAKEKALRAWAKTTGHTVMMAGAAIGKKPKTVVR